MSVDFIGVGAQKAGTSWVYACLFEHPEVCAPIKELHFFSRPRYAEGINWYEDHFTRCRSDQKVGEFSTSYLYSDVAAQRIAEHYPNVKLIAIVRHPVARAYSQYGNAIKAGEITPETDFATYTTTEPSCLEQGKYAAQLERYHAVFPKEQLLVLVYEDIENDPLAFIQRIYKHIGVNHTFVPPSLQARINVARVPKHTAVDRWMHQTAEWLRQRGLSKLVHLVKRSGLTDRVRSLNTAQSTTSAKPDLTAYCHYFYDDVQAVSTLLGRDLTKLWKL